MRNEIHNNDAAKFNTEVYSKSHAQPCVNAIYLVSVIDKSNIFS